jgi:hypothetical protein
VSAYEKLHENHLRENRPKMYQELMESGQLKNYLSDVAERARNLRHNLLQSGLQDLEAQEFVNEILFPPSEKDQPVIGQDDSESAGIND